MNDETVITLPDNTQQTYPSGVNGQQIAASISNKLRKTALGVKVDGVLQDLNQPINSGSKVEIITGKDDDGLTMMRHSIAHVMAQAVKQLYPETQVVIGPVIKDGFYYDFAPPRPFNEEDLGKIEKKMQELIDADIEFTREVWEPAKASKVFEELGESYKAQIIQDIDSGME